MYHIPTLLLILECLFEVKFFSSISCILVRITLKFSFNSLTTSATLSIVFEIFFLWIENIVWSSLLRHQLRFVQFLQTGHTLKLADNICWFTILTFPLIFLFSTFSSQRIISYTRALDMLIYSWYITKRLHPWIYLYCEICKAFCGIKFKIIFKLTMCFNYVLYINVFISSIY